MYEKTRNIGMIGSHLSSRPKRKQKLHYTRGLFAPAIAELQISLDVVTTNAPINEKEGNKAQARLERTNARSFKAAIDVLKRQK